MPTTEPCPYCRTEIDVTARKCAHCGEWVKERPTNPMLSGLAVLAVMAVIWVVIRLIAGS